MHIKDLIKTFDLLGNFLRNYLGIEKATNIPGNKQIEFSRLLDSAVEQSELQNPWFTKENILLSLSSYAHLLNTINLEKWLTPYSLPVSPGQVKKVGVISAGNIPLVGFHDMLSVLISGHFYIGKLSEKDKELMKAIGKILSGIDNRFGERIEFAEKFLKGFDAIIATGSNNSGRYFEYYFGKYPHIIRKNRNSIAILNGNETQEEMQLLVDDIFKYFGLGCRNVSMIYLPEGYDIPRLIDLFHKFSGVINHHKYANNYEYNRAVFLINRIPHYDSGFVLLNENPRLSSPIAVLHYQFYKNFDKLMEQLQSIREQIQCIAASHEKIQAVPFGKTQMPELWDYADGVDTISFLKDL